MNDKEYLRFFYLLPIQSAYKFESVEQCQEVGNSVLYADIHVF